MKKTKEHSYDECGQADITMMRMTLKGRDDDGFDDDDNEYQ